VPLSSRPERVKTVFVGEKSLEVERTWMHGDELILKFAGVDTISDAQKLAGAEVAIPFEQRAALGEDEYYESDLVGCEVFDASGRSLGRVTKFEETGGAPLLHIGELMIPFAKSICTEIDPTNKRIVVAVPDGLLSLNVPDKPMAKSQ
jgi:16S rRNA processing protein RimM